jgi:hypothetical protein
MRRLSGVLKAISRPALGWSWLGLTLALAVHVVDEAANDFLAVYNPVAQSVRARTGLPFPPSFDFQEWIVGLSVSVVVLLLLARVAFKDRRLGRWLAVPFALLMLGNGLGHVLASLVSSRAIPGVWSAPLLILFSSLLLMAAVRPPHSNRGAGDGSAGGSTADNTYEAPGVKGAQESYTVAEQRSLLDPGR